ncbi:MAG: MarC family protein [Gammaproteobacteria bacterium]|nr:MarC family protein [Gammaproteobacteria bacterium]
MDSLIGHSITVFLAFFAVMNPIANAAAFIGLTGGQDNASRKQTAIRSILTAFCIILFFCILGKAIFELFGITLPALRITGGVLIFLVGFHMLQGQPSKMHVPQEGPAERDPTEEPNVAISPLAIPILAGPGTIATAINYSATGSYVQSAITIAAFSVLCVITFVAFLSGDRLIRILGRSGMDVVTRLMGLILAVVGTQMLIRGIHGAKSLF